MCDFRLLRVWMNEAFDLFPFSDRSLACASVFFVIFIFASFLVSVFICSFGSSYTYWGSLPPMRMRIAITVWLRDTSFFSHTLGLIQGLLSFHYSCIGCYFPRQKTTGNARIELLSFLPHISPFTNKSFQAQVTRRFSIFFSLFSARIVKITLLFFGA